MDDQLKPTEAEPKKHYRTITERVAERKEERTRIKRGRKPKCVEGKRLYKRIEDIVMKGVTYQRNVAAALGLTYVAWQRMCEKPGSKLREVYAESVAKRDALVQRAYYDIMADENINMRIKADFVKTEKLLIDKRAMDEEQPRGFGIANPGLYLTNDELMAALMRPQLQMTFTSSQPEIVSEIQEAEIIGEVDEHKERREENN
jgi:hypothetical protein